jgi:hypothetical protein
MRNITLVGTALAALTATMLLASPASAQRGCREICVDGNCRMRCYRDYHRDYDADRGPGRGGLYMYSGRNRDHYRDRDYYRDRDNYGDRRPGIRLHVPGVGGIHLGD